MKTTFVAVGPYVWGKGKTFDEARKNCLTAGCSRNDRMIVCRVDFDDNEAEPVVTQMGFVQYAGKLERVAIYVKGKKHEPVTGPQLAALNEFAKVFGRNWKTELNDAWSTGNYGATPEHNNHVAHLQTLRNTRGPSWLVAMNLQALNDLAGN